MKHLIGIAPRGACATALTLAVVIAAAAPAAVAQGAGGGARGTSGPEGTIGRGFAGGGSHMARPTGPAPGGGGGAGYGYPSSGYYGYEYPYATYSSGYSYAPTTNTTQATSAPYLTGRYYEPGDGYRYPLYYNPATGGYVYYPVRR
ncbi:MAG: hypothetical protein JO329_23250 [Planctomycetaceae bacterium]|nr:hypothetical protein [Planctomycetaceae bacterium]